LSAGAPLEQVAPERRAVRRPARPRREETLLQPSDVRRAVDSCSKCGACTAECPVYETLLVETFSPRARVQLLGALHEGDLNPSRMMRSVYSACLMCRRCTATCPNGLEVDLLALEGKLRLERTRAFPSWISVAVRALMPRQERLAAGARLLRAVRLLLFETPRGEDRLARRVLRRTVPSLARVEGLVPTPAPVPFRKEARGSGGAAVFKADGRRRARVLYFTGCLTNLLYPEIGRSTARVLARNGVEVVVPPQECCGIPALANGDLATAKRMAARNVRLLSKAASVAGHVDAIVVDCASCGSTLSAYPRFLDGMDDAEDAIEVAGLVRHVTVFLAELGTSPLRDGLRVRATYHDPCHLARGHGCGPEGRSAPRELLRSVPGLELVEMEDANKCCGGAGSFCFTHPALSRSIGGRKADAILETGASLVVTSCPACIMQLRGLLKDDGVLVKHVVEVLDRRGEVP